MKSPKKFAEHYLYYVLGRRKGCHVLEDLDEELVDEIIQELANLIKERDKEVENFTLNNYAE